MLEPGNQAVDGEGVAPRRFNLGETGWLFQAGPAHQSVVGQRQGADLAMFTQPGQLGFAAGADGATAVCRFITEQTVLFIF